MCRGRGGVTWVTCHMCYSHKDLLPCAGPFGRPNWIAQYDYLDCPKSTPLSCDDGEVAIRPRPSI
jgi:hypothetical protein